MGGIVSSAVAERAFFPHHYDREAGDEKNLLVYDEDDHHMYFRTLGSVDHANLVFMYSYGNCVTTQDPHHIRTFTRILAQLESALPSKRICFYFYDFPKYGKSDDTKNVVLDEYTVQQTARTMYQHIHDHHSEDADIILWGRSVGSSPTCHIASQLAESNNQPAGIILESPVGQVLHLLTGWYFPLPFPLLDNIKLARSTPNWGPTLLVHGTEDRVIACEASQRIHSAIQSQPSKLVLLDGKDHNDIRFSAKDEEFKSLCDWLRTLTLKH